MTCCSLNFSIVVPVLNRPNEIEELLQSLVSQTDSNFEVLIMEGDSTLPCDEICKKYEDKLNLKHIKKANTSRSFRRNLGIESATGNYFVLFDSDCIIPPPYFEILRKALKENYVDCFGGPDNANDSFNNIQRAVNYSMTSIITTGGIRGAAVNNDKFLPRAFNMGFSKQVYDSVGGYGEVIGEDIDLSMRIRKAGFSIALIKEAFVYHKRRLTLKKFFKQTYTFGKSRVLFSKRYKNSLKLMHLFPLCFVLGNILLIILSIVFCNPWFLLPIAVFILSVFFESLIKTKNLSISLLSILSSYAQLGGYGLGFLDELITQRAEKESIENLYRQ